MEAVGFVLHRGEARFDNYPELWRTLEADTRIKVVFLHRENLLHRYISHQNMDAATENRSAHRKYSEQELREEFLKRRGEIKDFRRRFRFHESMSVSYEELCIDFDTSLRRVQDFLCVEPLDLSPTTRKIDRYALNDYVPNFEALAQVFKSTEWSAFFR